MAGARSAAPVDLSVPPPGWIATRLPRPPGGSALAWAILRLLGWQPVFDGLGAKQGVLVVYPHTSNWDFPTGLLFKWGAGLQLNIWAKDSLFRVPLFGRWMRWLGGIAVDRRSPHGIVGAAERVFRQARQQDQQLWLVVTPEGTRSHVPYWKSGFYQLAVQAQVPLGLAFIDFGAKRVGIGAYLMPSGDAAADMALIADFYAGMRGKRHAQAGPIRLKPK